MSSASPSRVLTGAEKEAYCNSFKAPSGRNPSTFRHMSLTLENPEALGLSEAEERSFCESFEESKKQHEHLARRFPNPEKPEMTWDGGNEDTLKSPLTCKRIAQGLLGLRRKHLTELENCVIVEETVGGVVALKMALEIRSETTVPVPAFLKMLYGTVFPKYHGRIQLDPSKSSYLKRAGELAVPSQARAREMDMEPFVFGETLYHLLMRVENGENGAKRTTKIDDRWWKTPVELRKAAMRAGRSRLDFVASEEYGRGEFGATFPFTSRVAFDGVSRALAAHENNPERQAEQMSLICGGTPERFNNKRFKTRNGTVKSNAGPLTKRAMNRFKERSGKRKRALDNCH